MTRGPDRVIALAVAVVMTAASFSWLRASLPRVAPSEFSESDPLVVTWISKRTAGTVDRESRPASPGAVAHIRSRRVAPATSVPTDVPPSIASHATRALFLQLPDTQPQTYRADPMRRPRNELAAVNPLPNLTVRDSSFLARLGAMSTASACAELRALLRRGSFDAPHPDVILRSMQARGCAP